MIAMMRWDVVVAALLAVGWLGRGAHAAPPGASEQHATKGGWQRQNQRTNPPFSPAGRTRPASYSAVKERDTGSADVDERLFNRNERLVSDRRPQSGVILVSQGEHTQPMGVLSSARTIREEQPALTDPQQVVGGNRVVLFSEPKDDSSGPKKVQEEKKPPVPPLPGGKETPGGNVPAGGTGDQKIGEAPPESRASIQFLRDTTVLLNRGEYQFDVTLQYQIDDVDFVAVQNAGGGVLVGEARTRRRLLYLPLEFRYGLTDRTQVFVNVPFGWSNTESVFTTDSFSNTVGIGDVSAGFSHLLYQGENGGPQVLWNAAFSAPTGRSSVVNSLLTPGSQLGQGTWSVTNAITVIHTIDPLVMFYGLGYTHRFDANIDGVQTDPGEQVLYRFGIGFAVNSKVTLSGSFLGFFLGENKVEGVSVPNSQQEPMYVRLAATVVRGKTSRGGKTYRTIEPYVNIGLTESAIDSIFGVSFTF